MARKYSDSDIEYTAKNVPYAEIENPYLKRLVRGYNRGLSRDVAAAKPNKGNTLLTKMKDVPPVQRGTGKPVLPRSKQKSYGKHIQKIGKNRNVTRVNAVKTSPIKTRIDKAPDSTRIPVIYIADKRTGEEVRAVNPSMTVGDLKAAIKSRTAMGMSWDDAFYDAIMDIYDAYEGDGSDPVDELPPSPTNIVVYFEAA